MYSVPETVNTLALQEWAQRVVKDGNIIQCAVCKCEWVSFVSVHICKDTVFWLCNVTVSRLPSFWLCCGGRPRTECHEYWSFIIWLWIGICIGMHWISFCVISLSISLLCESNVSTNWRILWLLYIQKHRGNMNGADDLFTSNFGNSDDSVCNDANGFGRWSSLSHRVRHVFVNMTLPPLKSNCTFELILFAPL